MKLRGIFSTINCLIGIVDHIGFSEPSIKTTKKKSDVQ